MMSVPLQTALAQPDGPPYPKRQKTTSPPDTHSPGMALDPAPPSAPQGPAIVEGDKPKDNNVPDTQAPPKFKMKRTGTSGIPPRVSFPGPHPPKYVSPAPKPSTISPVTPSADQEKPADGAARETPVKEVSSTTHNGPLTLPAGLQGRLSLRDSSQNTTASPSPPTSGGAGGHKAELANTANAQSLAMKRKWATGVMDGAARKAAQTRRLNAERRVSDTTISDTSTPEHATTTSTPVAAAAINPSLGVSGGRTAGAATPSTTGLTPPVVTDSTPPQSSITPAASQQMRAKRPVILPPKKAMRNSLGASAPHVTRSPHVSRTPLARSLSNRPYDMVHNENGRLVHGFGALFPDGYAPLPDPEGKGPRWICPVQTCTHERSYLKSHGKHFVRRHQTCLLNDNGDGTFSVVGYDRRLDGPVVVSRDHKNAPAAKDDASEQPDLGQGGETDGPFWTTPSGRGYTTYPDHLEGGKTFGVLIPDGYERLISSAENPFVCPVDTCLSSWASQTGLSIHFAKMHGACTFNDNLDGTLAFLGRRDDDVRYQYVRGCSRRDALVVSQKGHTDNMSAGADKAEPQTSFNVKATPKPNPDTVPPSPKVTAPVMSDVVQVPASQRRISYLTPAHKSQSIHGLAGGALEIWNYIRPHLTQFTECPDSSWIPELLALPRVRDIVWNDTYMAHHGFTDKVSRDVATLVVQVTGEIPPKTCSRCRDGNKGPFGECIVISSQAPIDARLGFTGCASCIYNGQGTYCTLKFWGKKRAEEAAAELEGGGTSQEAKADREHPTMPGDAQARIRRSERVQVKEAMLQSAPVDGPDTPYEPDYEDESAPPSPEPPQRVLRAFNRRPERQEQTQQQQPMPISTDSMEIEDWELAPGRLRSAAAASDEDGGGWPAENMIAFSRPYLSASQSVRVNQDVAFRVEVVTAGSSLRWAASPDRVMRVCSVGAGKVRVRIQGEEHFDLGPHGMFRLSPGQSCVVLNRLYGRDRKSVV